MELNNKQKDNAEYERFVDLMARMFLKYGTKFYRINEDDIGKYLSKFKCDKRRFNRKGA